MGFMDWLFGSQTPADAAQSEEQRRASIPRERHPDEVAVERYRYLLRTAPPETIEQAHAEAFAQLTPEQRALVFQELSAGASPQEQPRADDPRSLAQAATRRELQAPGSLERSFSPQRGAGAAGGGMGFGGMLGSSMLGSIAGVVIGSAIAQSFIPSGVGEAAGAEGTDAGADGSVDAGSADGSVEAGGDGGGGFFDGGDSFGGGDFGDFGF